MCSGVSMSLSRCQPQVPQGHVGRQPGLYHLSGGVGEHYLAAVRGRRDPGCPVHVKPDIAVLVAGGLTGVQAHPDPDRGAARPVMAGQGALARDAAADGIPGRLEHHEETVALGAQFLAAGGQERGPQQRALS